MPHLYIWQQSTWPHFTWDGNALLQPLGRCRFLQGQLLDRFKGLGLDDQAQAEAETLVEETMTTSEIEGQTFSREAVRSSVVRRLGLDHEGLPPEDRNAAGLVDILLDAIRNSRDSLTIDRLFSWQAALFPTGYSGLAKVTTGAWRTDANGPMQVVSGPVHRRVVHFEAVPAKRVPREMDQFVSWWDESRSQMDGIIRAGVAHIWFLTIHPFEDGNGRLARTISDMALAQDEGLGVRFFSISSRILAHKKAYYQVLEKSQKGSLNITDWLLWFLNCHEQAMQAAQERLSHIFLKVRFLRDHAQTPMNQRQRKVVDKLLNAGPEGFAGGLTTRKYMAMTKASRATASREIADLLGKGVITRNPGGGRSASYAVVWPEDRA